MVFVLILPSGGLCAESKTMLLDREYCRLIPPGTGGGKILPPSTLQFKGTLKEVFGNPYCYIEIPNEIFYKHFQFCALSNQTGLRREIISSCSVMFYGGNSVAFDSQWPRGEDIPGSCSFSCLTAK